MNNSRRKRISKIADALNELKGQIDELYEEEQEAFENIPESLQGTERYEGCRKCGRYARICILRPRRCHLVPRRRGGLIYGTWQCLCDRLV